MRQNSPECPAAAPLRAAFAVVIQRIDRCEAKVVPRVGFEPTAYRLRSGCSTAELSGRRRSGNSRARAADLTSGVRCRQRRQPRGSVLSLNCNSPPGRRSASADTKFAFRMRRWAVPPHLLGMLIKVNYCEAEYRKREACQDGVVSCRLAAATEPIMRDCPEDTH